MCKGFPNGNNTMTTTATECRHYWQSGYGTNTCLYCGRTHPSIRKAGLELLSAHRRFDKSAKVPA